MRTNPSFRQRRFGLVRRSLLGLSLVALVGACGGADGDAQGTPRRDTKPKDISIQLVSAAEATSKQTSARVSMVITYKDTGVAVLDDKTIEASGAVLLDGSAGELSMDLASLGIPGADGKIEMLMVDRVVYMDFGTLMRQFSSGEEIPDAFAELHWLRLDTRDFGGDSSASGLDAGQYTSNLEYLKALTRGDSIKDLGADEVDGVATDHFRVSIDGAVLAKRIDLDTMPKALRATMRQALKGLADSTLRSEVWIGVEDRLVRRQTVTMPFPAVVPGIDANAELVMDMRYADFGVTVRTQAPPASEVMDFADFLQALQNLG